jgi:PHAX RNA-binding domain
MIDTSIPVTPIIDEQAARTALARSIADQLHETESEPRYSIRLSLKLLGTVRVQALVDKALAIESAGGMLTTDGKRRRTPGGTFFHLLRQACTPEQRTALFPPDDERPAKRPYTKRAAKLT